MSKLDNDSWNEDVLDCLIKIETDIFSLNDVYMFEAHLSMLHPDNKNVRAKIRQQLQLLRDYGKIEFVDNRGTYRKLF
ncbi:hypothetical protein [Anaeropeptidivorans aminofermentans]|uniref:hypothetical protein n=1 Tax=Anaeropeptidivorans aminofermentans TaxID=2934315 RepID=UPI00202580CA|nr:hypothetical protein [Anaeropeptidivorans aminofermentans]